MAVEYIAAVWQISPYSAEKLLVQLALADWSNLVGESFPSHTEIASKARITKRRSISIIGQMIADGELNKLAAGGGAGHRNRYQFAAKYRDAVVQISQDWLSKRQQKGDTKSPNYGDTASPNQSRKDDATSPNKSDTMSPKKIKRVTLVTKKGDIGGRTYRKNRHEPSIGGDLVSRDTERGEQVPPPISSSVPASVAFIRQLTQRYPDKALWPRITQTLGENFDQAKIRECYTAWVAKGYNKMNLSWLFEWYVKGVPQNGNGHQRIDPADMNAGGKGRLVQ